MKKTIKIIDLLVKIANGEEVPKKIIYGLNEWFYDEDAKDYFKKNDIESFQITYVSNSNWLNLEVEIIEEDKKINTIDCWYSMEEIKRSPELYNIMFTELKDKINELIDAVNELKEKE